MERQAGCITIPEATRAVAENVGKIGARAVIADSSAVGVNSEKVIEQSGYVKGCPPNNYLVVKAIIGDRAEADRRYADA